MTKAVDRHCLAARAVWSQLYGEGVTDLQLFEWLRDEDFSLSGIDIVARRAAKLVWETPKFAPSFPCVSSCYKLQRQPLDYRTEILKVWAS